jgi:hypothetical protein
MMVYTGPLFFALYFSSLKEVEEARQFRELASSRLLDFHK